MREIKFIAYYPTEKRFLYFDLEEYANNHSLRDKIQNEPKYQFTGLKDKNEKEIYEGDILDYGEEIRIVKTIQHLMILLSQRIFKDGEEINLEVIGNIYENKELLK
jgi:hypothetical protein